MMDRSRARRDLSGGTGRLFGPSRIALLLSLLGLALGTVGGTCVVVEEGPDLYEEPGENAEEMERQEVEVMDESNR